MTYVYGDTTSRTVNLQVLSSQPTNMTINIWTY